MKRDSLTLPLDLGRELIIDNFAGGGGTSEGLEQAFGRPVDIAINHDPEALAMHAINHPLTHHLCESVWDVDPIKVTKNQPVALVWLSPDCKHFSKAKGGTPVAKHIRGLAWVGMRWVAKCKPRVLMLENVEEFKDWGPLIIDADGMARPDPAKKGKTFESFLRQLRGHGYTVDHRELRACDNGAPTIRKRLFLIARRDGLPIVWPDATHAGPDTREVLAGKLMPWRTAAECIDFGLPAQSVFGRPRALADNTQRRVAKGLWRHVLTSAKPFIVNTANGKTTGRGPNAWSADEPLRTVTSSNGFAAAAPVLTPFLNEHANSSNQRTMAADEPLRTVCAQVKGGHFSVVAPALAPLRGTSEGHMGGHSIEQPLSTVSAGGTHHALAGAHLITVGYGERAGQDARTQPIEQPLGTVVAGGVKQAVSMAHLTKFNTGSIGSGLDEPIPTITAGGTPKRPSTGIQVGLVNAHLVDMGHGEGKDGTKRFSHGVRSIEMPLNTVTASGATSALVAACLEQANGGFYEGDGRAADAPSRPSPPPAAISCLVTAYCVKYYSSGGQDQSVAGPMHTLPTKGRMGLVQTLQVSAACLAPEHAARARQCAELLHQYLPEHFTEPAEMVLVFQQGQWWVLVDITLRMLKPRELFNAQGFPEHYVIHEIPDPAHLFANGVQAANPLEIPRRPLTATAQVRMCGNSVSPYQAKALAQANFRHEAAIYGAAA